MQPTQGEGPWSSADYRNGSDIESDNYPEALIGQEQRQAYTDQVVATFGRSGGIEADYPSTQLADASGNYFGISPSDVRGFFPGSEDAFSTERRPADPLPGTTGPRRFGPDAFSDGIAKSFAEDAARRKVEAGPSLREWLTQENPIFGTLSDAITDYGIDVGRDHPIVGGAIQAARWLTIGDGSNADLLLAAAGPIGRLDGKIALTAEERLAARVESANAERTAAKLAGYEVTETIEVSGRRAAGDIGKVYEAGVRERFYGQTKEADYDVFLDGAWRNGRADATTEIAGRRTAVDAKYVEDWAGSNRNPANSRGPWDWDEQATMLDQARRYSAGFPGGAVYHTNSVELANAWSKILGEAGLTNINFIITPAVRK